jgi:acylphosphatase
LRSRAHIYVSGKVQGVFYRYETKKYAELHSVNGWVRNMPDGRVECLFEGEKEEVEKIIEFCRQGPPAAHVDDVEIQWEEWKEEFDDFQIKY